MKSIRKKKNLFVALGMSVDFTKEDYKLFGNKILKDYAKDNKWGLKKEKVGEEGYVIRIHPKNNLSAEYVLRFINTIKSMLNDIQEEYEEGQLVSLGHWRPSGTHFFQNPSRPPPGMGFQIGRP